MEPEAPTAMPRQRLTQALVASDPDAYAEATQSAFLRDAARGRVSKPVLGRWLANDRLYIHSYINGLGRLLSFLALPDLVPAADARPPSTRLVSWAIDALVNIRREEAFFVDTAAALAIPVNLDADADGHVPAAAKLDGLRRFEALFAGIGPAHDAVLPWLECAVVYFGTERCYLDAWSYARAHQDPAADARDDADGGAVRSHLLANWTSPEFADFVAELGDIIDDAVDEQVAQHGQGLRQRLMDRALAKWRPLLAAETAFWDVSD